MTKLRAAITCVSGWAPEDVLSNKDLEKMVDTNDEWIQTRTGIIERRILKGHAACRMKALWVVNCFCTGRNLFTCKELTVP